MSDTPTPRMDTARKTPLNSSYLEGCKLERELADAKAELAELRKDKERLVELIAAVRVVQYEKTQSELSGFGNGFEHPNTITAYNRLVALVNTDYSAIDAARKEAVGEN